MYIKGWSRAEIDTDWLKQFERNGRYQNTGLRCDNIIAFDIDVLDEDLADSCEAYVERHAGETDLCRVGRWPKRLLLYRLEGEPGKSGRTGKYGGHMVELLATHGRQFIGWGIHPGTGEPYQWVDDIGPGSVLLADLPAVTAEDAQTILTGLDELLIATGLPSERKAHMRDAAGTNEYDLMEDTEVMYEGEIIAWGELSATLTSEGGFGNFYREEYEEWGDSSAVHFFRAYGSGEPCAHDFINDCTHWTSMWNPKFGELLPPPPKASDNVFVPPDMSDLTDNCVLLSDKTVRRLDHPMRVYPLEGFIRARKHLQVPHPNPPASNPNKLIAFTEMWERDPKTLRADYASLRPDHPDKDIIIKGSEKIMNTYLPPAHEDAGGECATFLEFINHLIPGRREQFIYLDWLSHKLRHPGDRMHGMVMVTPEYGTGRGTLVQIMQKLFGIEYVNEVELSDLIGTGGQSQFNSYMADSLIVTVAEALEEREEIPKWSARHIAYERLKIVCDTVSNRVHVRRKYGHNSTEQIFASLFISSNHTDALVIEPGDRRLVVIENCEIPLVKADNGLYERIQSWQKDPANIADLYTFMCTRASQADYKPFGEPPMTPAKERMIESGQSDVDRLFEIFIEEQKGDLVTVAQWRHWAHLARLNQDFDLPSDPQRRDRALAAVIAQKARRIDTLPPSGIKVKGRPVRPWIIRNFGDWKGCEDNTKIRAEILRNGEPGGIVVELPTKS